MHALIWRGKFHPISYSAYFLKGKGNSGQQNRCLSWGRACPIQVTTFCDSLCPDDSQRGQTRKHASPTGHTRGKPKGYMNTFKRASLLKERFRRQRMSSKVWSPVITLKQVEIQGCNDATQNAVQQTFIRYLQCLNEDK